MTADDKPDRTAHAQPGNGREATCGLCGKRARAVAMFRPGSLRSGMQERLRQRLGERFDPDQPVCGACLRRERVQYVLDRLQEERGALSAVEKDIAEKAANHSILAEHIDAEFDRVSTFGQRVADRVASVGGSWTFVLLFVVVLAAWIVTNSLWLGAGAFDPYPYILLNLALSCIAALQAPVIMMSQNRMSKRDRARADQDFRVNLKAEIEIASLHEKVDHQLHAQWQRMFELQEMQIEILQELEANTRKAR
jgi:uncharacterized membrane protein